jgi:hypothetical protein
LVYKKAKSIDNTVKSFLLEEVYGVPRKAFESEQGISKSVLKRGF